MSSTKPSSMGTSDPLFKGKGISDITLDSEQDEGWEVYGKKTKNKAGNVVSKPRGPQNPTSRAWGHPDTAEKLGMRSQVGHGRGSGPNWPALSSDARKHPARGYTRSQPPNQRPNANVAAPPVIPPPLKNGWGRPIRATSAQPSEDVQSYNENDEGVHFTDVEASKVDNGDGDEDDESDGMIDSDEELLSDDFDSDDSPQSHEDRKNNRWFKEFFQCLDVLTVEQINEPERQWHCPACKGGPGAIDWYRGLQPLITHARTKRSKRAKLHRELAELLDEELRRRGTSAVPAGEVFGKWKGLEERADKEIVWPPMVVIMNTQHEQDDNDKWIGMGNQELLDYFSSYPALKARHSYGPKGHRGMSVLIFEASAVGHSEAERLSKHFQDTFRDRLAWERNKVPFYLGGKRQLYGYMAEKCDIEDFNKHSAGKSRLKYEMRSYQEMVVNQMKQMSEDNQQLLWFKNKAAKEQKSKKALEESFGVLTERLRKTAEENRIVKLRTKQHHEQNQEEMDYQELFFREQLQKLHDARNAKEEYIEKIQEDQREKVADSEANASLVEESLSREEGVKEFQSELEKLKKVYEERKKEMQRKHFEETLALEREYDVQFNQLVEKYTTTDPLQEMGDKELV